MGVDDPSGEGQEVADGAADAARPGAVPGDGTRRAGTIEATKGVAQSDWREQERRILYVGLTWAIEAVHRGPPRPTAPPRPAPGARTRGAGGKAWGPDEDAALMTGCAAREGLDVPGGAARPEHAFGRA